MVTLWFNTLHQIIGCMPLLLDISYLFGGNLIKYFSNLLTNEFLSGYSNHESGIINFLINHSLHPHIMDARFQWFFYTHIHWLNYPKHPPEYVPTIHQIFNFSYHWFHYLAATWFQWINMHKECWFIIHVVWLKNFIHPIQHYPFIHVFLFYNQVNCWIVEIFYPTFYFSLNTIIWTINYQMKSLLLQE